MDIAELFSRFAVALGIGLLIGLERGWKTREDAPGSRTAGIRTFALVGLLGGVVGALTQALGDAGHNGGGLLLGLCFTVFAATFALFCRDENRAEQTFSATTAIAGMTTFALGAYALLGDLRMAGAAAVAATTLLAARDRLHGFVKNLTWEELHAALILLAMTFVALPLVPDEEIGPLGGVNLRQIWLIAIVLATVSFAGYAAVKYFGETHGTLLAAAAGGLVSSTAVTLANARRAATGEGSPQRLAAGVALAAAVSFLRVIAIVAVLKPALLALTAPPLIAAALVASGFAVVSVYWRATDERQTNVEFRNPFSLLSVLGLAASMGVIIVIGRLVHQLFGSAGAIAGAATMGIFDVDAVTVSIAQLVPQPLDIEHAAFAILTGVATNTLSKIAIGVVVGRGWFAIEIAAVSVVCLIVAAAALWLAMMLAPG